MAKRQYPKRPRDVNELAKLVADIATGDAVDEPGPAPDPSAVKRGKARAASLTPRKRRAIAKKAARTRWNKKQ